MPNAAADTPRIVSVSQVNPKFAPVSVAALRVDDRSLVH